MPPTHPDPLVIGRIPFLVCAPFFHASLGGLAGVRFVDGTPRRLNALLAEGAIDCAPSSSLEYARHSDQYLLLPGLCTSGRGEVKSVLLFSRHPWEALDGKPVSLSEQSDTSNALFQVLSHFRFGIMPVLVSGTEHQARIAIGDEALRESNAGQWAYRYDLAEVWETWQRAPLPFGLWMLRTEAWEKKQAAVISFYQHLRNSLADFAPQPGEALRKWSERYPLPLGMDQALAFFPTADYALGAGQLRSLEIFYGLCREIGILPPGPGFPLRFAAL